MRRIVTELRPSDALPATNAAAQMEAHAENIRSDIETIMGDVPHWDMLRAAMGNGNTGTVKRLFDEWIHLDANGDRGWHALLAASESGHVEIVTLLLDMGARVNTIGSFSKTALHAASENGHFDIVQLLLDQGVDVNTGKYHCGTALHATSGKEHVEAVQPLLESGANVNLYVQGSTAMDAAVRNGQTIVVELLLKHGATLSENKLVDIRRVRRKH